MKFNRYKRNDNHGSKINKMILNYIVKKMREKAEEYGIKVKLIYETSTSSICHRCGS